MKSQRALLGVKQAALSPESDLWRHAAVRPLADHEAPLTEHQVPRSDGRDFSRVPVHASGPEGGHAEVSCPLAPRRCPFGGACHTCPTRVQAKRDRDQAEDTPAQVPPIVHEVLRSPGQPLDPATVTLMEARFSQELARFPSGGAQNGDLPSRVTITRPADQSEQEADETAEAIISLRGAGTGDSSALRSGFDFSEVMVHTDSRAVESAGAVGALAYTVGTHIVFGRSMYEPHSVAGQRLLAHELAHTIQQSSHGVTLNRQDDGTPPCPESTTADFCQPFESRAVARSCREYLLRSFIPLDESVFGTEVAGLWRAYLSRRHGESLRRRVFSEPSSQIVQGFVRSTTTAARQRQLTDRIKSA
jgi:hypothetical protein